MLVIFLFERRGILPRDGTKNLKPINTRTKEEQTAIQIKGGKASGKARRKKANHKKTMETQLSLDVIDKAVKKQLEDMGMEGTNEALLAFSTLQQAARGNQKPLRTLSS